MSSTPIQAKQAPRGSRKTNVNHFLNLLIDNAMIPHHNECWLVRGRAVTQGNPKVEAAVATRRVALKQLWQ